MSAPQSQDSKLGQLLLELKLCTPVQIADALADQVKLQSQQAGRKLRLGEILVFKEVITLPQLQDALRKQVNKGKASREASIASKQKWDAEQSINRMSSSSSKDKNEQTQSGIFSKLRNMLGNKS